MATPPKFLRPILARIFRGVFRRPIQRTSQPSELLELYSTEGCPACRRVRRALTELDLDFIHRSCPVGDSEKRAALEERGGKIQVPFLVDPNTGVAMYESRDILAYLSRAYGEAEPAIV